MSETLLLARRAVREVWRIPAATIPALFIPVFFLVVNLGQVNRIFPTSTPFLHGQHYVAFQIPVSLVFAVSSATSGLAMVTDIDIGYLDKLLAAPIRRTAIVWGDLPPTWREESPFRSSFSRSGSRSVHGCDRVSSACSC